MMSSKFLLLTAACTTALSPIASTVAWASALSEPSAAALSSANLATMETTCETLAASYDTGNGDIWEGEVVLGVVTKVSGPTEQTGTRVVDQSTIQHAGTYVPATLEIRGNPFRNGGSVNMFGDQWSTAGYWTDSTYNYEAKFDSTFSHAFSCKITKAVYHAAYSEHVPAIGEYVVYGHFGESEGAVRGNCAAFTAQGFPLESRPSWWGVEIYRGGNTKPDSNGYGPHCRFEGSQAQDIEHEAYHEAPVVIGEFAQTAINQDQTDTLNGFEAHGGRVNVTGAYPVGKVVVCISPSSNDKKGNPGAWRAQNGYSGEKCTTEYFMTAPWGGGSQTSQGTYISVPNYTLPNT